MAKAQAVKKQPLKKAPKKDISKPKMPSKDLPKSKFSIGDSVVYPAHGVGRILNIETFTVGETEVSMFAIEFPEERMTLRVPTDKAEKAGLRKLSSKDRLKTALETLKGKSKIRRMMWSRRAQEYETKIKSGDPVSIAEVVRDLHRGIHQPEQSYSERQIYQFALERLAREVAAVEKIDENAATQRLETFLEKTIAIAA